MRASGLVALGGFLLLIQLAGCAASVEYIVRPVPVPTAYDVPHRASKHSVAVGVDPYMESDRQKAFFGLRLGQMGVLPVQLLIRNQRNIATLVRPYEVALLLSDSRAVMPVGTMQATERTLGAPVQFSPVGRSAVYSAPATGGYAGPEVYGSASGVAALTGIVLLTELGTQRELYRQLFSPTVLCWASVTIINQIQ